MLARWFQRAFGTATVIDQVAFDTDSCSQFALFFRGFAVRHSGHVH